MRAEALLHERIASSLASLVFVVLALPLALRVERTRSLAVPALQGVAAIFFFYMINQYGGTLATQGITPAAGTAWTIVAVFLRSAPSRSGEHPR